MPYKNDASEHIMDWFLSFTPRVVSQPISHPAGHTASQPTTTIVIVCILLKQSLNQTLA